MDTHKCSNNPNILVPLSAGFQFSYTEFSSLINPVCLSLWKSASTRAALPGAGGLLTCWAARLSPGTAWQRHSAVLQCGHPSPEISPALCGPLPLLSPSLWNHRSSKSNIDCTVKIEELKPFSISVTESSEWWSWSLSWRRRRKVAYSISPATSQTNQSFYMTLRLIA